jgi:pilus assembly protein Flp/PilA
MTKNKMLACFRRFLLEEEAATAVEYGVMLALIVAVCIVAIQSVGSEAKGLMEHCQDEMDAHMGN